MSTLERREFLNFTHGQRAPTEGYWLHISRPAMACRFEVTLPGREREGVAAASEALDEIDRIEQQLTVYRDDSEISFVNRNAASGPVRVAPSLFALLRLCEELHRETEGAFDVTSGPLIRCWGFMKREGRVPAAREIEEARSCVGQEGIALDREARTVRFARPGVEINFGSIGKGYALDCVARHLRRRARSALLSAGYSSMRAIGGGDIGHRGWLVGVRDPRRKDRRVALLRLRDCAMSTSGSEEQFFEREGKRYGHIIDPRTGYPAEGVSGVSVVAPTAAESDALATAFYVGGRALAEAYCARHPGVLAVLLESGATQAALIGGNENCEVKLIDE